MNSVTIHATLGDLAKVHTPITGPALAQHLLAQLQRKNPHHPPPALLLAAYVLLWSSKVPALRDVSADTRDEAREVVARVLGLIEDPSAPETGEVAQTPAVEVLAAELGAVVRVWRHRGRTATGALIDPVEEARLSLLIGSRDGGSEVVQEIDRVATALVEDDTRAKLRAGYQRWIAEARAAGEARPPFQPPPNADPEETLDAADEYFEWEPSTEHIPSPAPEPEPIRARTRVHYVSPDQVEKDVYDAFKHTNALGQRVWMNGQEAYEAAERELEPPPARSTWEMVKLLARPAVARARHRLERLSEGYAAFRSAGRLLDLMEAEDRPATMTQRMRTAWRTMSEGEAAYYQDDARVRLDLWADLLARLVPASEGTVELVTSFADNLVEKLRATEEGWPDGRRPVGLDRMVPLTNARWYHLRRHARVPDAYADVDGPDALAQGVFEGTVLGARARTVPGGD